MIDKAAGEIESQPRRTLLGTRPAGRHPLAIMHTERRSDSRVVEDWELIWKVGRVDPVHFKQPAQLRTHRAERSGAGSTPSRAAGHAERAPSRGWDARRRARDPCAPSRESPPPAHVRAPPGSRREAPSAPSADGSFAPAVSSSQTTPWKTKEKPSKLQVDTRK
eukprot:scaffold245673_cov32-Tisochrysis_lutea.AAC.1